MGFSLRMFFNDLNLILNNDDMDAAGQLKILKTIIKEAEQYAKECGQLD